MKEKRRSEHNNSPHFSIFVSTKWTFPYFRKKSIFIKICYFCRKMSSLRFSEAIFKPGFHFSLEENAILCPTSEILRSYDKHQVAMLCVNHRWNHFFLVFKKISLSLFFSFIFLFPFEHAFRHVESRNAERVPLHIFNHFGEKFQKVTILYTVLFFLPKCRTISVSLAVWPPPLSGNQSMKRARDAENERICAERIEKQKWGAWLKTIPTWCERNYLYLHFLFLYTISHTLVFHLCFIIGSVGRTERFVNTVLCKMPIDIWKWGFRTFVREKFIYLSTKALCRYFLICKSKSQF